MSRVWWWPLQVCFWGSLWVANQSPQWSDGLLWNCGVQWRKDQVPKRWPYDCKSSHLVSQMPQRHLWSEACEDGTGESGLCRNWILHFEGNGWPWSQPNSLKPPVSTAETDYIYHFRCKLRIISILILQSRVCPWGSNHYIFVLGFLIPIFSIPTKKVSRYRYF